MGIVGFFLKIYNYYCVFKILYYKYGWEERNI